MADIRQSILLLDGSLKVLGQHYDGAKANEFKLLSDQIGHFEKRWTQLIDSLEQCSTLVKSIHRFLTLADQNRFPFSSFISAEINECNFKHQCEIR